MTKESTIKFIEMLINYNPKPSEPTNIKIVFGSSSYASNIQYFKTGIDAYEQFGGTAFLLNNICDYKGSESRVWNIILGCDDEDSVLFLKTMKYFSKDRNCVESILNKLVMFLYFEKGLLLLNRETNNTKAFNVFADKSVSDVLFVGKSTKYKSLSKFFPRARLGVVYHPSTRAHHTRIYKFLDSKNIETVTYYKKKFPKTNFESFHVIDID